MLCRSSIVDGMKRGFAYVCRFLPLQDKIVFSNFYGRGLGDDPKYILLELLRRRAKLSYVWLLNDMATALPQGVRPMRYASFSAIYHLSTAKMWIDNARGSYRVKKRAQQFFLQTWHSTLSLKKHEAEAEGLTSQYVASAKRDAIITDLMYANNSLRLEEYKRAFWYDGQVVKCDVPRMAILLHTPRELKEKVLTELNISKGMGVVLYAPTFRQNNDKDVYDWCYGKVVEALSERYGKPFVFLLRLHPHLSAHSENEAKDKAVVDVSNYSDMQELLAVADVLVTDFCGCMFDFGVTQKPVFLFAKDYEKYLQAERKLLFTKEELPFSVAKDVEQLMADILHFDALSYARKVDEFYEKVGWHDGGEGDKQVADMVLKQFNERTA